jgi:hypothetical protein
MSVIHVDFMYTRSEVSKPLDYQIDYKTGTLSLVDSWQLVAKQWGIVHSKLTLNQSRRVTGSLNYAVMFTKALKVTKDRHLVLLCTESLAMISRLEASKASATN